MSNFMTIAVSNHKADPDLGANSRAHWRTIRSKQKADKQTAYVLILDCLQMVEPSTPLEFLTVAEDEIYTLEEAYPIRLIFRRLYSGKAQQWDDDNLMSAYKGFRDGVAAALGVNDKHFVAKVEQFRIETGNELKIEITPAWSVLLQDEFEKLVRSIS